ncbi:hypothetical protein [Streptomyces lonarensis]|uniref:Condensation domain-containing protein n=1 Tax=Streptomyces lonarensis TaxID=700599 RepID=A0A7X6CZX4_9ACTN|nr:hypothetical protein [Streptomyces lonarensis]NJQ05628.1 hypothetical protein [Streptomyces lonarensis]
MTAPTAPQAPVLPPTRTVAVPLAAEPAAAGGDALFPLTWSQQYYLAEVDAARLHGRGLTVPRLYRLRAGTTETAVATALRRLVEGHDALRSRVVRTPEGPRQRVPERGTLLLAVHEAPAGDAGPHARAVLDALAAPPLDPADGLPLRAALVSSDGEPRFLALAFSHVAVDAYALVPVSAQLVEEIAETDPLPRRAAAGSGPGAGAGHGPRQQAAVEASPAGERAALRALRLAEETYRRAPAGRSPEPLAPANPRHRFLSHRSAVLSLAVGAVAARTGQSPAAVLAAALVALDAARSPAGADGGHPGQPRFGAVHLVAANRLRPETAAAVLPFSQPVPCCVDTAGVTFDTLVHRTAAASLRAYRAGGAPPDRLADLLATVERERGVRLDATPVLNWRPRATALPVRATTAAELANAAAATATGRAVADPWRAGHYLSADVDADGIALLVQVDTAVFPPDHGERHTAALERLLREAALDPALAALPDPTRPAAAHPSAGDGPAVRATD